MTTFHVNPKAYSLMFPVVGHDRYEPTLVVAALTLYTPPAPKIPTLEVKEFEPIFTDRWVCVYGTNGSPRDRMRHDAQYAGERYLTHPYMRIAEAR